MPLDCLYLTRYQRPMNDILTCKNIEKSIGDRLLFKGVSYSIKERDRIGLIGPNGAGKSTFMKLLAKVLEFDDGEISIRKHARVVYIPQVDEFDEDDTILEAAVKAFDEKDALDDIDKDTQAMIALSRIGFEDFYAKVSGLSGGWKKRLSIARQIAREPDVLLLDEPTNHLDLDGIEWLEKFLKSTKIAFMVISHDRRFLQNATNRTLEISDRFKDTYWSYDADYVTYLERKDEYFESERQRADNMANKARMEKYWLDRGVRGRGTKQNARKKEAYALFEEAGALKSRTRAETKIQLDFEKTDRKTKRLALLHNISKRYGDKNLIEGLDLTLVDNLKIGLLGSNGCGKSTLMNIINKTLEPDTGTVTINRGVKVIKFDQDRGLLDPNVRLRDAISPSGGDMLEYRGEAIHVVSWARRLKFRSDQLDSPVKTLSGGEQARVLMGQLMLQPCDILLLDEPTNDLDIPALEVLEESLQTFPGCLVLVTHDREMLDRVCDILLAFDGEGNIEPFASYEQWKNPKKNVKIEGDDAVSDIVSKPTAKVDKTTPEPAKKVKKLSYKEQKEWDSIEEDILVCETAVALLEENIVDTSDAEAFTAYCAELSSAQLKVETLYARWSELETLVADFQK
jgi:ATP-binding cassette subfamily F protein uup